MPDELESGRRWFATKLTPKAVAFVVEEMLEQVRADGDCHDVNLSVLALRRSDGWDVEMRAVAATNREGDNAG